MVAFYSPGDQAIYNQGYSFIPRDIFRLADPNLSSPTTTAPVTGGVNTIPINMGGGGGGGTYTGGISDLTGDFFKTTSDRQDRLTELNRPLNPGTFNVTSNLTGRGRLDPMGSGYYDTLNRLEARDPSGYRMSTFNENFAPSGEVVQSIDYNPKTNPNIKKAFFESVYQSGPQVFDAEKPTLNRRINDAFYSLPFLSKPQSADQILAEGYTGQSNMPGIMSMVLGSMDKYGKLPRGDQAFIARNMGYTGPTVFGENTTGGAKDPFGLNVRSGFGNYAEAVEKQVNRLDDYFGGEKFDKRYGEGTTLEFDEETGTFRFVGTNAAKANQMNKMNLAKYNFYKKQVAQRDADRKAAEEAEKAAAAAAAAERNRVAQVQSRLDSGTYVDRDDRGLSASDRAVGGGAKGRAANIDNDKSTGTSQGYTQHYMDGGLVDLVDIYD